MAKDGSHGALFAFRLQGTASRAFALPGLAGPARHLLGENASLTGTGVGIVLDAPYSSALVLVSAQGVSESSFSDDLGNPDSAIAGLPA